MRKFDLKELEIITLSYYYTEYMCVEGVCERIKSLTKFLNSVEIYCRDIYGFSRKIEVTAKEFLQFVLYGK